MKVYKCSAFQTEDDFLSQVADCRAYLAKRRAGEDVAPEIFHVVVMEYAVLLDIAELYGNDPEPLEFILLTEEEARAQEKAQAAQDAQAAAEVAAVEQRNADLAKASQDADFKHIFMGQELAAKGFDLWTLVWMIIRRSYYGDDLTVVDSLKAAVTEIEDEIAAAAQS